MKNITKIGMGLFVVIAMIFLVGGEVQAKGPIHGTVTMFGGPPNETLRISLSRTNVTLIGDPNPLPGPIANFRGILSPRFDSSGTAVVHFAFILHTRSDVASAVLKGQWTS